MTAPRVRIAPSPTGPLHIGTARTALFNYLFARHTGGTFILRLEDTDQARSSIAYEKDILDGLHWLGLRWDEGPEVAGEAARGPFAPYRQMLRLPLYAEAAERLLAADLAYPCYCTPEELDADRKAQEAAKLPPRYVGRCAALTAEERAAREAEGRRGALRFRVGTGVVAFDDIVRGRVEFDVANLGGDFVIVRGDGTPLYHFTVVVDDAAMEISHVIRGEDHLSNTPKHILLFRALGYPEPQFAHLPLILNADRTKMSKRKSQTAVADYIAEGFIREALVNYLALLGWATGHRGGGPLDRRDRRALRADRRPQGRRRLRSRAARMAQRPVDPPARAGRPGRSAAPVRRGGAGRRPDRLDALGRRAPLAAPADHLGTAADARRDRRPRRVPVGPRAAYDPALLVPKRWDAATTIEALRAAREVIGNTGALSFEADELEPPLRALAEERGWKAGRPVHGDPGRGDRPDRDAAALRHARRARPRADARAAGPGDRDA